MLEHSIRGKQGAGRVAPVRRACHALLALVVAMPAGELPAAPATGTIQGRVRLEGRPVSGVTVAFIELQSGSVVRAVSKSDGGFSTVAPTGEYAVTTESQAGLAVGQAPVRVAVADGRVASAEVELVAVASAMMQDPAAGSAPQTPGPAPDTQTPTTPQTPAGPVWAETTGTGAQIQFEPVTCFLAGEFPLLDTSIEPIASVARARVYFKGAAGDSYYYVEMTQEQGRYFGKLPRPRVEATRSRPSRADRPQRSSRVPRTAPEPAYRGVPRVSSAWIRVAGPLPGCRSVRAR